MDNTWPDMQPVSTVERKQDKSVHYYVIMKDSIKPHWCFKRWQKGKKDNRNGIPERENETGRENLPDVVEMRTVDNFSHNVGNDLLTSYSTSSDAFWSEETRIVMKLQAMFL